MKIHERMESVPDGKAELKPISVSEQADEPMQEKRIISKALKNDRQYSNPRFLLASANGPRACFIYDWGFDVSEKQERILKTDRLDIKNGRAKLHYDNGCTTLNDVKALSRLGLEAFKHHISPVLDFW